jgi:hypothetical protein
MKILNPEAFRKKIAGLKAEQKEEADINENFVKLISLLPMVYGDSLPRMQMWQRIANGLEAAISKSQGSVKVFYNNMLKYIRAEPASVAENDELGKAYSRIEDKAEVLDMAANESYTIIAQARQAWLKREAR